MNPAGPAHTFLAEARERVLVAVSGHASAGEIEAAIGDEWILLAILEAVLAGHRPVDGRCPWCRESNGYRSKWPCGEYLTIETALRDAQGGAGR